MENSTADVVLDPETGELFDALPREEALVRLYELAHTYGRGHAAATLASTESARHFVEHGHPLTFGCCREAVRAA